MVIYVRGGSFLPASWRLREAIVQFLRELTGTKVRSLRLPPGEIVRNTIYRWLIDWLCVFKTASPFTNLAAYEVESDVVKEYGIRILDFIDRVAELVVETELDRKHGKPPGSHEEERAHRETTEEEGNG